jgi:hypothetical protein
MRFLRWLMGSSCLLCLLWVGWTMEWYTRLDAPGRIPMRVHHGAIAPVWTPPMPTLSEVLRQLGPDSEWQDVPPATITFRTVPNWNRAVAILWHLLVLALLVPGWIYWRVRGRERDSMLQVGLCCAVVLATPLLAAYLWMLAGG